MIAKVKELLRPALKATALELLQNENTQVLLNLAERFYQDAELFNIDLLELMLQNEKLQEKATEIIQTLWNDKRATVSALNLILKKLDADVSMSYLEQIVSHLDGPEDSAAAVSLAILCKNEGEVLVSLMVALHRLDKKVPIKKVEKAINLFLKESSQYSQSVMSVVIPKLASEPILSSLITRTYYLSCLSYPELIPITNTALSSLIRKLWKDELLWGDFVYYCQKLFPQTVDLIITLTPKMLDGVLSGLGPQIDEYFKNNRALLNNPRYRVLRQQINK